MNGLSRRAAPIALLLSAALISPAAQAASLRVSPILIDLSMPSVTATVTLNNEGLGPLNVQARVFQWVQQDGAERLVPTKDVVASPPISKLAPGTNYTLRIVRTGKAAFTGQASYRLLVDEIPDAAKKRAGTVSLVVRQSIPVFFSQPDASLPKISWQAKRAGRQLQVTATNAGQRRLKISRLKITGAGGKVLVNQDGLVGYVLGGSSMRWNFPLSAAASAGTVLGIAAESESGAFTAKAPLSGG